ncbi:hypothetical protein DDI_0054 [Dickeya dianthicola RNS04.9]|nr:hypothetical protein DDI_0054 [Dickeya dianthicola RNS04.9]
MVHGLFLNNRRWQPLVFTFLRRSAPTAAFRGVTLAPLLLQN